MGQKIHPHGLRVGVIKDWDTRWISKKKEFANYLIEDHDIRNFLSKEID
jgi:small subunit ribosomal protein S3